jgi:hypothetical protein
MQDNDALYNPVSVTVIHNPVSAFNIMRRHGVMVTAHFAITGKSRGSDGHRGGAILQVPFYRCRFTGVVLQVSFYRCRFTGVVLQVSFYRFHFTVSATRGNLHVHCTHALYCIHCVMGMLMYSHDIMI